MRSSLLPRNALLRTAATLALPLALVATPAHASRRASRSHSAPGGAAAVTLHPVSIPDGSGTLALPAGWRITDHGQGMVAAAGSEGSICFGFHIPMATPAGARYLNTYGAGNPLPIARSNDPGQVAADLVTLWGARGARVVKELPTPSGIGPAAFVLGEYEQPGRGRLGVLSYVVLIPRGDEQGIEYYTSWVAAPAARLARSLPVLVKIWASWKTDDRVFQQRLARAAESMRESARLMSEANANRVAAQERANTAHDLQIRGTWWVEDRETGRRTEVSASSMKDWLAAHNRRAGYQRYRELPQGELNR